MTGNERSRLYRYSDLMYSGLGIGLVERREKKIAISRLGKGGVSSVGRLPNGIRGAAPKTQELRQENIANSPSEYQALQAWTLHLT